MLPKAIALQKRQKEEEKWLITQMNAENPLIDVLPNAGFKLNIKKLIIDDVKQPLQQIKGSLN